MNRKVILTFNHFKNEFLIADENVSRFASFHLSVAEDLPFLTYPASRSCFLVTPWWISKNLVLLEPSRPIVFKNVWSLWGFSGALSNRKRPGSFTIKIFIKSMKTLQLMQGCQLPAKTLIEIYVWSLILLVSGHFAYQIYLYLFICHAMFDRYWQFSRINLKFSYKFMP